MEMKRWNRGLLALVALLLILSIIATVNIIIKQYSTEKMEFGSWSDWFNTAGTLGTFAIAAMAYRKAPDWIKQRKHEDAFSIAKDIFFEIMPAVNEKIDSVGMDAYFLRDTLAHISDDIHKLATYEQCENNLEIWYKNTISPLIALKSINKLRRLGWHIKPEALDVLNEVKNHYRDAHRYHVHTWLNVKTALNKELPDWGVDELRVKITNSIESLASAENNFRVKEKEFYSLYVNIEDYFDIR